MRRRRGSVRIGVLLTALAGYGCAPVRDPRVLHLQSIPAHWVEQSDRLEPKLVADFMFDALSFSTPTDGWIVGHRYLLHVTDTGLSVVFVNPARVSLNSVNFRTPDAGWAGGRSLEVQRSRSRAPWALGPSPGAIWRFSGGGWQSVDLTPLSWPDWSVSAVRASARGEIWATGFIDIPADHRHRPGARRFRPILLRSGGTGWTADESPHQDGRNWAFYDICFDDAGSGWFVGADLGDDDAPRALAVRRSADTWQRTDEPADLAGPHARLSGVACSSGGRAVALGESGHAGGYRDGSPVLLRYDGIWQRIELPVAFQHADVGAMAAVSDSDVWLALSSVDRRAGRRPAFLHWTGGEWSEVPAPPLPEGRHYAFSGMQFVSPTEGWAIANDHSGPGIVRGLIFHYRDGVWRNRNWSWHFWDQHLFGLFGD